jgi:hypothetical protein
MTKPETAACTPQNVVSSKQHQAQHVEQKQRSQSGMVNQRPAPHATTPMVPSERQEYRFR